MARAIFCAGLLALAAVTPSCVAEPTQQQQQQMEWEAAAVDPERTAPETQHEPMTAAESVARMAFEEAQSVQEMVLESVTKEVQNLFASSVMAVPGMEGVDSATETVKQVVDRVRERLAAPPQAAEAGTRTASALKSVTTDLLKEIMVQEAVIETLWAVVRDTQLRPWITSEHQALQTATTQAVSAYLTRMQDRMRYAGFSEEDITKLLPRSTKTCGREGPTGLNDTCPERNMGKKRSYGYYGGYHPSYGYSRYYPSYGYGSYYPSYGYGRSYPSYGYDYGYPRRGYHRRMAERETAPEGPMGPQPVEPLGPPSMLDPAPGTFPLTGLGPFARALLEEEMMMPEPAMQPEPVPETTESRNMGARRRSYYRSYYPAYGYSYGYYGRPTYYSRPYSSYYPSYGYPSYGSYGSYPSYGYYPSYRYYGRPYYGRRYMRSVEVPEMEFSPSLTPEDLTPIAPNTPPRGPTAEPVPMSSNAFRRAAERIPIDAEQLFEESFEPAPYDAFF